MEAKTAHFMYCSNVERKIVPGRNDIMCAIEPLSHITIEYIPGMFSFSIVFSIIGVDTSIEGNTIQLVLKNMKEEVVFDTSIISLPVFPNEEENIPKEYKGINMSIDLRNVVFEIEGVYTAYVFCNGNCISEHPIYVGSRRKVKA